MARPVKWPDKAPAASDGGGKFASPRCLDPDGRYQVFVPAKGYLEGTTPWKDGAAGATLAFGDVVLRRFRTLEGQVVDQKGNPVAGARVSRGDPRQRAEATTDASGRFKLNTALLPPGFLFVEKDGFRFHGQRCDRPEELRIVLTRRDEPPARKLTALPPAWPLAKRRALAERLQK